MKKCKKMLLMVYTMTMILQKHMLRRSNRKCND